MLATDSDFTSPSLEKTPLVLRLVIIGVAFNGLVFIAGTLLDSFIIRNHYRANDTSFGLSLISGLTLLYLSSLLARQKRTAWLMTLLAYSFVLGLNITQLLLVPAHHSMPFLGFGRSILLPLIVVAGLIYYHEQFTVKSDIQSFTQSIRIIIIILAVTFAYGVAGYLLMDTHDFHHEITIGEAIHRTIDQFGLTTNGGLVPYTRRAKLFTDSLSIISIGALVYSLISLFQPLRARFVDQAHNRIEMERLLREYPSSSEDFFKLWPHDKLYFFNQARTAGVALHVHRGICLIVGDPAGDPNAFPELMRDMQRFCHGNDWSMAFIHTDPKYTTLYESYGYTAQKIGEEAILDLATFNEHTAHDKYFRQIRNRFQKQDYTTELLKPPHHQAVIDRMSVISKDWLSQPGRTERGLMMGYFSAPYLNQCPIMVVRDAAGTIQAFINQVPSFDPQEANYDLLCHTTTGLGNINDFLLMGFIDYVHEQGFQRLNLGLCPLAGLDNKDEDQSLVDSALRFAYANGDRLYSFSGLQRFKAKYEPTWHSRYIVYSGGLRGFTRTVNALNQAMKVHRHRTVRR